MERENITGNTLIAESVEIATLVDYQRSTVVSRTIIERNAGSVTLFDFDKGQGLSEHTAPFDALACILDGEANITIRSPARQEHAYSALVKGRVTKETIFPLVALSMPLQSVVQDMISRTSDHLLS